MFFTSISQMMTESVDLTLVIRKANGQLTVSTLPKANGLRDEAANHIIPLTLTGTPEEMDAEFLQHIMQPIRKATGLISNMMEFEQQADKAAANSKAVKDAKAKETKEEKEKREKYEKHLKKAEELITAKNHKDAILALQQARMYATANKQKEVDEKIAEQKKAMNQGSLFDMMEEAPAAAQQVVQQQNVAPQPAQQPMPHTIQPQVVSQQPRQMPPQPQQTVMRHVQQPMHRPVQQQPQPQYGEQTMFNMPQGGYPPQNMGQQHPHYPQGEIPMFPHHEEPPMPEDFQQAYMHDGPAYRPEDYEEYPDFPQSMLENHYSQAYAQTV
ncbi:MAG: PRTRC system protein E [Bacteroidaceae bacterium]|nr:PRTRC system protein E [Bacteroidaceae bacterium]MBO7220192.1 PRTRC system protein E [Alistipes sp.]